MAQRGDRLAGLDVDDIDLHPAVDADGEDLFPPRELELIDDPGVITDDTLAPDEGVDDPDPKPLERA